MNSKLSIDRKNTRPKTPAPSKVRKESLVLKHRITFVKAIDKGKESFKDDSVHVEIENIVTPAKNKTP